MKAKAIIAEDEPLLCAQLQELLAQQWPELDIVAVARDGIEALAALVEHRPDVAFLDIRMPGATGLEVARAASGRCHVVFLTAYDEYAAKAFDHGAVDYVLKPVEAERFALAIARVQAKLNQAPADLSGIFRQLGNATPSSLRWIHASCGLQTRIIAVEQVAAFVAEAKYTRLLGVGYDAHIRKTIKELSASLDPEHFCQISRSAVVNLGRVERVLRDGSGNMKLSVAGMEMAVSQSYQAYFRQM
ncbi:MAG: LytTR family DNA-binding domain-containing protein [Pseudomonadota bacterium]